MDLRTTSYIEFMEVACSDSVSHNRVKELSILVLLLACNQDWTCNLQIIVPLEAKGTNAYNRYAMCPAEQRCGDNNKDEDTSPKTLNYKNHQASSQKFRQQTPEEGRRTYRPKRCGNNHKDEDNSPKTLNNKIHQAPSQKLRQQTLKKTGGHIGRNVVKITIKMKTIIQKPLIIKFIKLRLRN